jgi:hypothetical protein
MASVNFKQQREKALTTEQFLSDNFNYEAFIIACVSLPASSRPPPEATSQTMLRKKTVDLTGTPVFPHAQWCIRYMPCTHGRVYAAFARGGSYDAPFPFDCPVANEEKALVTTASRAIEEG